MKLTTADIKKLISTWLSQPGIAEQFHTDAIGLTENVQEHIDRYAGYFNLPPGTTAKELGEHQAKLFADGNQWARNSKRRMGNDVYEFGWFSISETDPEHFKFYPDHDDMFGYDEALAKELHKAGKLKKCWHREFNPKNDLADNYRLEVLTDPDDTKIVVWQIITD